MELIPRTVRVTVPVNIPELRGRHATTPPHGVVTSFRCPVDTLAEIDAAIRNVDPTMSRGLFMRLAALHVAQAINQHVADVKKSAGVPHE